jgi:hypothetical protein
MTAMPTPEQEIQKIIEETTNIISGVLFDVSAGLPPSEAARIISNLPTGKIIDDMNTKIKSALDAGYISKLKVTTAIAPIQAAVITSYVNIGSAEFLSRIGDLAGTVKAEVARGILSGAGRKEIMQAINGSTLRPDQLETLVNTGLSTFSRTINATMAKELPADEKFVYIGPMDEKTRDVCIEMMAAGPLTVEEIEEQFPGALVDGGGFNCRHNWELDTGENVLHDPKNAQKIKDDKILNDKWKKPRTLRQTQAGIKAPAAVKGPDITKLNRKGLLNNLEGLTTVTKELPEHLQRLTRATAGNPAFKAKVGLAGVPNNMLRSITNGLSPILNRYNVKVDNLGLIRGRSRNAAQYERYMVGGKMKWDGIRFRKNYVSNSYRPQTPSQYLSMKQRAKVMQQNERLEWSGRSMPTSRKTAFDRRQVFIDNAERFTISTVAPDRVTSTAIHEAWHAVDHHKKLNGKWQQALKRNNVTLADKYKVSEYAASKDAELFAETGTAIELKIKIPANVKKAFEETIEGV